MSLKNRMFWIGEQMLNGLMDLVETYSSVLDIVEQCSVCRDVGRTIAEVAIPRLLQPAPQFPTSVRVPFAVDERSFVAIDFCYDEDAKMVELGSA